jgi:hypothetical protein
LVIYKDRQLFDSPRKSSRTVYVFARLSGFLD